jgi:hypothetical protein
MKAVTRRVGEPIYNDLEAELTPGMIRLSGAQHVMSRLSQFSVARFTQAGSDSRP